jgi:hypothetical protein
MTYTTEDCKALLDQDAELVAQGFAKADWKRLSKRKGAEGPERVFGCSRPQPRRALVVELPDGLWLAAHGPDEDSLADPARRRPKPGAAAAPAPKKSLAERFLQLSGAESGEEAPDADSWLSPAEESDKMRVKAARSLASKMAAGEADASRVERLALKGLATALANQHAFALAPSATEAGRHDVWLANAELWDDGEALPAAPLPLGPILPPGFSPLPAGDGAPGRWAPPAALRSPFALARALAAAGFVHSPSLQRRAAPGDAALAPILAASERLAAARAAEREPAAAPRSWSEGPECDPAALARAERAVRRLLGRFDDEQEDDGEEAWDEISSWPVSDRPALARQFLFFIDSESEDFPIAIVTPALYTRGAEGDGAVYDQECPIDELMPGTPGATEDANGCGTWLFPEYAGNAAGLARDLVQNGFVYADDLQRNWAPDSRAALLALFEADELSASLAGRKPAPGAARRPRV